jgi:hypothetical protein
MRERDEGVSYPLEYRAANGFHAICEIRLYHHEGKTIVVATDLDVGPSVTNNAEVIATLLRERGIDFDLFCEHYEPGPDHDLEEVFDWVTFTWQGTTAVHPEWQPGTRQQVETAIGRRFE